MHLEYLPIKLKLTNAKILKLKLTNQSSIIKKTDTPPQIVLVDQMLEFSPTTISDIAIESFWGRKFVITKFKEMPLFTRRQLEKMKDAK